MFICRELMFCFTFSLSFASFDFCFCLPLVFLLEMWYILFIFSEWIPILSCCVSFGIPWILSCLFFDIHPISWTTENSKSAWKRLDHSEKRFKWINDALGGQCAFNTSTPILFLLLLFLYWGYSFSELTVLKLFISGYLKILSIVNPVKLAIFICASYCSCLS